MLKKETLDEKFLVRLIKIFTAKQWDIDRKDNGEMSVFDRFCMRLVELESDDDRNFMLDLTEKYLVVDFGMYEKCLLEVFKKFIEEEKELLKTIDVIHVFPLQDRNPQKTKSGNLMCYILQGYVMRKFDEFHNKQIRIFETFESLKVHKEEIQVLLMVDDYIGSGDTALSCISLLEEINVSKERMRILSLVCQNEGKKYIEDYGVKTYTTIERNKGISDNYPKEEVESKIEQMKKMGKRIKANKDLYLGYKDTESLVTMIKTPNNTFPIYWHECKKNKKITYAPYPRRGNVGVEVIQNE